MILFKSHIYFLQMIRLYSANLMSESYTLEVRAPVFPGRFWTQDQFG